jgi:hypothetical protein
MVFDWKRRQDNNLRIPISPSNPNSSFTFSDSLFFLSEYEIYETNLQIEVDANKRDLGRCHPRETLPPQNVSVGDWRPRRCHSREIVALSIVLPDLLPPKIVCKIKGALRPL